MIAIKRKTQQSNRTGGNRARSIKDSRLYQELSQYQEEGIKLWLDGRPSTSYRIAYRVRETANYMRDYYTDDQDQIYGIGFDCIRKEIKEMEQSPCAKNLNNYEYFLKKSKFVRRTP